MAEMMTRETTRSKKPKRAVSVPPMTCEAAMRLLESAGINLEERLPWGLSTSRQIMELFTEAARGVFTPDQFQSDAQFERFYHRDLARLSDGDLWKEIERAKFIVIWHEDAGEWVTERMHLCQGEVARRRSKGK